MQHILYCEINILCVIMLAIILCNTLNSIDKQTSTRLFICALISEIIFLLLDCAWILIDGKAYTWNYIINAMYFIQSGITGYTWFLYSENVQKSKLVQSKARYLIAAIPLVILVLLSVTSFKTGLLFYIDSNNFYHRGSAYYIQVVIALGYIFFTAIRALVKAVKNDNYAEKKLLYSLASFIVMPMLSGILQAFFFNAPLLCAGITAATLQVYINMQEQLISVDSLTQLNNRNQLMKYLGNRMRDHYSRKLYLIIADVDYLKSINDKFGHTEGDRALKIISNTLREIYGKINCFICRFGGDEFIVVCEIDSSEQLYLLKAQVDSRLDEINKNLPYTLSLSAGWANYTSEISSIQELIARADAELYKVKKARKH